MAAALVAILTLWCQHHPQYKIDEKLGRYVQFLPAGHTWIGNDTSSIDYSRLGLEVSSVLVVSGLLVLAFRNAPTP